MEHPDLEREVAIVRLRVPEASKELARQVAAATAALRRPSIYKQPGVAEAIDWAQALVALGHQSLDDESAEHTLGAVLKYREDQDHIRREGITALVAAAPEEDA